MAGYASPYGKPRGLRARLVRHRKTLGQPGHPWHGTGLIDDMELIMQVLNKNEWLEAMRTSDDPDAQRFAVELLDDDEEMDAVYDAVGHSLAKDHPDSLESDPVKAIEYLDGEAKKAQAAVASMRATLEQAGVVDDETPDDMLPAMLQALLA